MFPIFAGNSAATGYNLTRSLRFRSSASAYVTRTPASSGNRQTWTWSYWIKRGILSTGQIFLGTADASGNNGTYFYWLSGDTLRIEDYSTSFVWRLDTTQVFRDPSSWYHIVLAVDTTQATAANRVKLYVNGSQVTAFSSATYPSLNYNCYMNSNANPMSIGRMGAYNSAYGDMYMAETYFIDGQALTPSSFGSTNALTGVWQPARYTGSYGTNGFYLPFTDNSALTTSSNVGLGKDFSGNANYFVTNNISITAGVTYDSMTDVPTLTSATAANYCVGNPLSLGSNAALTNGNLSGTLTGSGGWSATICGLTSGKWYYEATVTANSGNSMWVGFISDAYTKNDNNWSYGTQIALYANDARNGNNGGYGASWTTNDVIGVALDLSTSSGSITFYKNGTSQGVMFSSLTSSAAWRPLVSGGGTGTTIAMNFGQRPFTYTAPTGYVALNTYNLPTSTIVKGNTVMDATLYTGTLLSNAVTNAASFKPDLVWLKSRSAATDNKLTDSVRGVTKAWVSNSATAETTDTQGLTAFGSAGFTVGTDTNYNNLAATYVGWQWQAGQGSSSSNTNGTITSTVSVNASAGFSVVSFTGNGTSGATVGHSLGVAPSFIIIKRRATPPSVPDSIVYHSSLGNTGALVLDQTVGTQTGSAFWNNTSPTSSVISLGNDANTNNSGNTFIAYAWTPIAGFSAFGSYTGNGSTDGPFVYTGFRPRWIMAKQSSAAGQSWNIFDTARNTYNVTNTTLYADQSSAEDSVSNAYDILSNGFKLRTSASQGNTNGATYIYAAFAENPFKNSLAR